MATKEDSKQPLLTWLFIARLSGLVIVFVMMVAFLLATLLGAQLDRSVVLSFLGIATGLLTTAGAGGWVIMRRNGQDKSG